MENTGSFPSSFWISLNFGQAQDRREPITRHSWQVVAEFEDVISVFPKY